MLKKSTNPILEEPIRDEIFSAERLEQFANYLAREVKITQSRRLIHSLLPRVRENYRLLIGIYHELIGYAEKNDSVPPAAEWIVDNFHIIEGQVREIQQDLPENFYRELPKVVEGDLKGYPRVYAIALALLAHTDSHLDMETIRRFLIAFQVASPLQIGEIWAIAIHLRIALVENIRRIADQAIQVERLKVQAGAVLDILLSDSDLSAEEIRKHSEKILGLLESAAPNESALLTMIAQRLRDQDPKFQSVVDGLSHFCTLRGNKLEDAVREGHYKQSIEQATARNIIQSMRLLSTIEWNGLFESVSLVDAALDRDPSGAYPQMAFESRNRYRDAIERISKRTGVAEVAIAEAAVEFSLSSNAKEGSDPRERHVGYFLVDQGLSRLEILFGYKLCVPELFRRALLAHPSFSYFFSLISLSSIGILPFLLYASGNSAQVWVLFVIFAITLVPVIGIAISLTNLVLAKLLPPRILPKMEFDREIPADAKTMVAVPIIFADASSVKAAVDSLEIRFMGNQDPSLSFAILGDFSDAETETREGDQEVLSALKDGIAELNRRHAPSHPIFLLFHRRRLWSESEGKWMGWERKRGKLNELNRFLRGQRDLTFIVAPAFAPELAAVKYVITLDADTQLPRGAARKLVATILHPLNAPRFDPGSNIVAKGYGVLQPRVSITLESSGRSIFSEILSGHTGMDPYTKASSDAYQDLFGEGICTGKGLYVVDAFERSLAGRVPESCLLSHDLFEGAHARTALLSDVELLDDYPGTYESFAKRQHRWTRGDWQIFEWIFPRVRDSEGLLVKNPLSTLSRWKIFDNLRRSLLGPTLFLWLALSWTLLPGNPLFWTLAILSLLLIPPYAHATSGILLHPKGIPWTSNFWNVWGGFWTNGCQVFLDIVFLAHQSYLQCDAILRTLYRVFFSKKNKLEWVSSASAERASYLKSVSTGAFLWSSPLLSAATLLLILITRPTSLPIACPFLLCWFTVPITAIWISRPRISREEKLVPSEMKESLLIARRTWSFFERFVDDSTHWLPPDNVQFDPKTVVAERTSPTNIGLLLLSTAAARDLGFITPLDSLERIGRTIDSMKLLERHHGHFLNWYDTATLRPLEPRYVSTVDSGNLAGHLIALKQSLLELSSNPCLSSWHLAGLVSLLGLIQCELPPLKAAGSVSSWPDLERFTEAVERCRGLLGRPLPSSAPGWNELIAGARSFIRECLEICGGWNDADVSGLAAATSRRLQAADATLGSWEKQLELQGSPDARKSFASRCHLVAETCGEFVSGMDFKIVYEEKKKLLSIGLHVGDGWQDDSYYDLLASEARLASFIAIGLGQIPQHHWFHLGRQLTSIYGHRILISWSASMFEYLMPLLVMRQYPKTLLYDTHHACVAIQVAYGRKMKVPWGVSESGYNARDLQQNYQYGPFGVPGIGLKRGLRDELVIAPYATALAALVSPRLALKNFRRMSKDGLLGLFGYYEAADFTPNRVLPGRKFALIKSFMAHHQGMSLCAFANVLCGNILQRRFHADALVSSTEVLLQERVPQRVKMQYPLRDEGVNKNTHPKKWEEASRRVSSTTFTHPKTQILSNGEYTVLVSQAGSGFSRCHDQAVTRWPGDPTLDKAGFYVYLRDRSQGAFWSATHCPVGISPSSADTIFSEHKAEFHRRDGHFRTSLEIVVSPEDNVELRHITVSNYSIEARELELTSYLEPVLMDPAGDLAHMAFSKLFLQTEFIGSKNALLGYRRPRSSSEKERWAFHLLVGDLGPAQCEYETDRSCFIGRNRTLENPVALTGNGPLKTSMGSSLDPIFSLRTLTKLAPEGSARLCFITGTADSRDEALALIDRYHDASGFERESDMAWTKCQVENRHLNIGADDANLFQNIATVLFYPSRLLRPSQNVLAKSTLPQPSLWAKGISGDIPIIVIQAGSSQDLTLIRQMLRCHEYLRMKRITFELVILGEERTTYRLALQDEILNLVRGNSAQDILNTPGGIYFLRTDSISSEEKLLIESTARALFTADRGSLREQVRRLERSEEARVAPPFPFRKSPLSSKTERLPIPELECANGYGGFSQGGREYVIELTPGDSTPAPWTNVVANEKGFGFIVTECGAGYSWALNSGENKLTPWSNDPVTDPAGEIIYIRDDETGEVWNPTPRPSTSTEPFRVRHGQGYSTFEHNGHGFSHSLTMFVPLKEEVKVYALRVKNTSGRARRLSAYFYVEWVLGSSRSKSAVHIKTEPGSSSGLVLAQNPFDPEFGKRIAFASGLIHNVSFTCDRRDFLGRYGRVSDPAALRREVLGGRSGIGLDPCSALQSRIELGAGEEMELIFLLGQADTTAGAERIASLYSQADFAHQALEEVKAFWDSVLGTIQVRTPDPSVNFIFNRWLLYQALSCRIWGRTAFYQAGGAFGFRDQLQDVMSLFFALPEIARRQLLEAARHQFLEGDVLHWWHPPAGRGVRTHISDDLLWLPYVACHYLAATGDYSILDEKVPFLKGPELPLEQEDHYFQPEISETEGSLFEHCRRAIERSAAVGAHGLPLMGTGDWNDGMNRVGQLGKGESVWLAWFLAKVLDDFAPVCERRGDKELAASYRERRDRLLNAIEQQAWDGSWYRRAYFDDGTPLGSKEDQDCQIDSIAQSWAVLSGLGESGRSVTAMASVRSRLVLQDAGLILLFTPPFSNSSLDPGYIKGYVPGVRENGGQYTHAAVWAMMAFAALGDRKNSTEAFFHLNPFRHSSTAKDADSYKVEPYVIAADIYGPASHLGRGGWTWYTGSAAWYYRAGMEKIFGLKKEGDILRLSPCAPESWGEFVVEYRVGGALYRITVRNSPPVSEGNFKMELDGKELVKPELRLIDDGLAHEVYVSSKSQETSHLKEPRPEKDAHLVP